MTCAGSAYARMTDPASDSTSRALIVSIARDALGATAPISDVQYIAREDSLRARWRSPGAVWIVSCPLFALPNRSGATPPCSLTVALALDEKGLLEGAVLVSHGVGDPVALALAGCPELRNLPAWDSVSNGDCSNLPDILEAAWEAGAQLHGMQLIVLQHSTDPLSGGTLVVPESFRGPGWSIQCRENRALKRGDIAAFDGVYSCGKQGMVAWSRRPAPVPGIP